MTPPGTPVVWGEGDILAGKYRIDKVLGVGGMGVVVAAHHLQLDEPVAIKFLQPAMLSNAEMVGRFAREARAAVKIKNEHVARVSDVGTLENGAPFMVMEYLAGSDLAAWLRERGPLEIEQAVEFVLQACEAIAEAHALGIIHRDLKPANLFVIRRPDGTLSVKVLDFGISKVLATGMTQFDAFVTHTQSMMGSPLYVSPEQMQSARDVDVRTDIWSLGVILYELSTGTSPFLADTVHELVAKILSMPPPSLRERRPDAPEGLEQVIRQCLEKDRHRRYASVGDLAVALMPFAPRRSRLSLERISGVSRTLVTDQSGVGVTTAPVSGASRTRDLDGTRTGWGNTHVGARRRTAMVVLGAGTLLFAGGAAVMLRRNPVPTTPAPLVPMREHANAVALPPGQPPVLAPQSLPPAPLPSGAKAADHFTGQVPKPRPSPPSSTARQVKKSPLPAASVAVEVSSPAAVKAPSRAFDDRK